MNTIGRFIGINKYDDINISNLIGATKDAIALYSIFLDSYNDIDAKLILDENATTEKVKDEIINLLENATEHDDIIISFSGHGSRDHRLVVSDTMLNKIEASSIGMDELSNAVNHSNANSIILFIDCCFSGKAPAKVFESSLAARDTFNLANNVLGKGKIIITASGFNEPAYENPNTMHGLLTYAIIETFTSEEFLDGGRIKLNIALENVSKLVRKQAKGIGYIQNPIIFNLIKSSISIKKLEKGIQYFQYFPNKSKKRLGYSISDLKLVGIPPKVYNTWKSYLSDTFLPLQLSAINEFNILNGSSLLVCAPTSSGKTFIGELAAISALVTENKKTIFLFPYRALVNEKFDYFNELYSNNLNLNIVRCSGDYLDQTSLFTKGKYDIAILTYEIFLSIILQNDAILHSCGLIVFDEIQFIGDEHRGITFELIFARLKFLKLQGINPQLILLSASVGGLNHFDEWLGVNVLKTDERPIPLEFGVIDYEGNFKFICQKKIETKKLIPQLPLINKLSNNKDDELTYFICLGLLRNKAEKILIFRNTKRASESTAVFLSNKLPKSPALDVLEELEELDNATTSRKLKKCLNSSVAFHNSNLNKEEKALVERSFKSPEGLVRIIVATSTLAAGINTPASTVIIVDKGFPWLKKDYSVAAVKNMAGRAGRIGYQDRGRAIILSNSFVNRDYFFEKYVNAPPESLRSSFDDTSIYTWLIKLLAQVNGIVPEKIPDLLGNTYGGFLLNQTYLNWINSIELNLKHILPKLAVNDLIERIEDKIYLTELGKIFGRASFKYESGIKIVEIINYVAKNFEKYTLDGRGSILHLLLILICLDEIDQLFIPFDYRSYKEHKWEEELALSFEYNLLPILKYKIYDEGVFLKRCKKICVIKKWVSGTPVIDIQNEFSFDERYPLEPGHIRAVADLIRFHLGSIFEIIRKIKPGLIPNLTEVEQFSKQLEFGLPPIGLSLLNLPITLYRGEYLQLIKNGIYSVKDFQQLKKEDLLKIIKNESRIDEIIAKK